MRTAALRCAAANAVATILESICNTGSGDICQTRSLGQIVGFVHVGHSCAVAFTVFGANCNVDSELQARGRTKEEVAEMLDAGYYDMEKLAAGGWLTALKYADELEDELKTRTGGKDDEFAAVPLSRYQNSAPLRRG